MEVISNPKKMLGALLFGLLSFVILALLLQSHLTDGILIFATLLFLLFLVTASNFATRIVLDADGFSYQMLLGKNARHVPWDKVTDMALYPKCLVLKVQRKKVKLVVEPETVQQLAKKIIECGPGIDVMDYRQDAQL